MDCGRVIRAGRRARQLSQRELAERARVPPSTVGRIEAGTVEPRLATLVDLLSAMGYGLAVIDRSGRPLPLDEAHDRLFDRSGRRFPAHLEAGKTPPMLEGGWWGWFRIAWHDRYPTVPAYTYWRRPPSRPTQPERTWAEAEPWDDAT